MSFHAANCFINAVTSVLIHSGLQGPGPLVSVEVANFFSQAGCFVHRASDFATWVHHTSQPRAWHDQQWWSHAQGSRLPQHS